jgi:hypothetical protein
MRSHLESKITHAHLGKENLHKAFHDVRFCSSGPIALRSLTDEVTKRNVVVDDDTLNLVELG